MASGAHTAHINDGTIMTNAACSACHTSTTSDSTTITNEDNHVNKVKDVAIAATYDSDAIPGNNWASSQCSNVYCHSTGQATTTYYTETWGTGTADCVFCHGGANASLGNSGAGASLTASHTEHTGTFGYTCNVCHETVAQNNTTILGAGLSKHVDKNRQVAVTTTYGGTGIEGGDFASDSCSTTNCHGSSSPTWSAGAITGNCSACHGMARSAAARDTAGNTDAAAMPVGAHDVHLSAPSGFMGVGNAVACNICHIDPDATAGTYAQKVNTAGHMNGTTGVTLAGYTAPNCTTTCHGSALVDGSNNNPAWTAVAYLPQTGLKDAANCGVCHGSPPPSKTVHNTMDINTDCSGCHGHNGYNVNHINGTLEASGNCNDCHDYDVVGATYAAGVWTGGTWGKAVTGSNPEGFGAHAKHINHIKTRLGIGAGGLTATGQNFGSGEPANVCGVCHTNTGTNHAMGGSTARSINFGDGSTTYQFGPSAPLYNGNSTNSSSVNPKSCSNISCHFTTTPVWSAY